MTFSLSDALALVNAILDPAPRRINRFVAFTLGPAQASGADALHQALHQALYEARYEARYKAPHSRSRAEPRSLRCTPCS